MLERLANGPYGGVKDLYERVHVDKDVLEALARAGAFDGLQGRRDALYQIGALANLQPPAVRPLLSVLPETPPLPPRGHVTTAGVVVAKQKPPTAQGFASYVVEDGPLRAQVVISPAL